jgi:hypothetical protein
MKGESEEKERVTRVIQEKKKLRVCSLSETFDCHLLWSHYASGFSGMAIEVELPDDGSAVRRINYRGVFASLSIEGKFDPVLAAEEVLSSKYSEWSYEKEIRVLHRDYYFELAAPVKRVIAGHRMERALFDALNLICHQKGIEFCQTGIGDEGIDADFVKPPANIHQLSEPKSRRSPRSSKGPR